MNYNKFSNQELLIKRDGLSNNYYSLRNKIEKLCDDLDKINMEYISIDNEIKRRKI